MGETQEPSKPPIMQLSWSEAPLAIMALVSARRRGDAPVLVGVTGPVGSGKSTLAARLGGVTVSTDDYLPDYEGLPEHERDLPERADLGRLHQNLGELRAGGPARAPVWCGCWRSNFFPPIAGHVRARCPSGVRSESGMTRMA